MIALSEIRHEICAISNNSIGSLVEPKKDKIKLFVLAVLEELHNGTITRFYFDAHKLITYFKNKVENPHTRSTTFTVSYFFNKTSREHFEPLPESLSAVSAYAKACNSELSTCRLTGMAKLILREQLEASDFWVDRIYKDAFRLCTDLVACTRPFDLSLLEKLFEATKHKKLRSVALMAQDSSDPNFKASLTKFLKTSPRDLIAVTLKAHLASMAQKDERAIIRAVEKLRALKPKSTFPDILLGTMYVRVNNPDKAREYFTKAVTRNPQDATAQTSLAILSFCQGNTEETRERLQQVLNSVPDYFLALNTAAELELKVKNFTKAFELFRKSIESLPTHPDAKIELAKLLLLGKGTQKDVKLALSLVQSVENEDPDDTQSLAVHGALLLVGGHEVDIDYKKAIELLHKSDLTCPFTLAYLGEFCLVARENLGEAEKFLKSAVLIDPEYAFAHARLGEVYRKSGQNGEQAQLALTHLSRAVELDPEDAFANSRLGALFLEHDPVRAREHLVKAFKLNPDDTFTFSCLQKLFSKETLETKDPIALTVLAASIKAPLQRFVHFIKAFEQDNQNPYALAHAAKLLMNVAPERAITLFLNALRHAPTYVYANLYFGRLHFYLKNYEHALLHLSAALEHDPKNVVAHCSLSVLYINGGPGINKDLGKAYAHAKIALTYDPNNIGAKQILDSLSPRPPTLWQRISTLFRSCLWR